MSILNVEQHGEHYPFTAAVINDDWHSRFLTATPFPHLVLDDFLPESFIRRIVDAFPDKTLCSVSHTRAHQRLKRGYRPHDLGENPCREYLQLFNTPAVLQFVEAVTGVGNLIADPDFVGGGLHEIERGGRLAVHADFTLHQRLQLQRRVNLLIYLNEDWRSEYGGNLELWDATMENCVQSIQPIFNRCVIFLTDKRSFHGHPGPLTCPDWMTRRSIAIYYYTEISSKYDPAEINGITEWQARPGSDDVIPGSRYLRLKRLIRDKLS